LSVKELLSPDEEIIKLRIEELVIIEKFIQAQKSESLKILKRKVSDFSLFILQNITGKLITIINLDSPNLAIQGNKSMNGVELKSSLNLKHSKSNLKNLSAAIAYQFLNSKVAGLKMTPKTLVSLVSQGDNMVLSSGVS